MQPMNHDHDNHDMQRGPFLRAGLRPDSGLISASDASSRVEGYSPPLGVNFPMNGHCLPYLDIYIYINMHIKGTRTIIYKYVYVYICVYIMINYATYVFPMMLLDDFDILGILVPSFLIAWHSLRNIGAIVYVFFVCPWWSRKHRFWSTSCMFSRQLDDFATAIIMWIRSFGEQQLTLLLYSKSNWRAGCVP